MNLILITLILLILLLIIILLKKNNKTVPTITKINGYNFLFLPLKCKTFRVECKIFGGNYLEEKNNSGISHLLEHMITNSWEKCYKNYCSIYLEKYGTISNAYTDKMCTGYWIQGLDKFKKIILIYILSIILKPHLNEKTMIDEIEAVKNELYKYINNSDYELINIATKTLYKKDGLRYLNDYNTQLKNLENITLKSLIDYSNKIISMNNLLFIISGSFEKNNVIFLIKNILQNIHPINNNNPEKLLSQNQLYLNYNITKKIVFVENIKSNNSNIKFYFPINIYTGDKDIILFKLIKNILAGDLNSLLLKQLRLIDNLIYGLDLNYTIDFCGTLIKIEISTLNKNVKPVIIKTLDILNKYSKNNISNNILQHFKLKYTYYLNTQCFNNPKIISDFYINQYFYQLNSNKKSIYTLNEEMKIINKTTTNDIRYLINKLFNTENLNIFYMSNKKINLNINDF